MSSICPLLSSCRRILPTNFRAEIWQLFKFAWPFIVSDLLELLVLIVSLQFIGQYGEKPLAAVGLGISFCNVFGFAGVMGLDTATTMLCSQSYGARNYRRYGIVIQRALLIQFVAAICTSGLWINSRQILILLQQDRDVSRLASVYTLWRLPSLPLMAIFRTLKSYLLCQQIILPLVLIGVMSLGFCILCNVILVKIFMYGLIGSSVSCDVTYLFACLLTVGYIRWKKIYKMWPGWSWECLSQWGQFLSFALPGTLMIFFDYATGECGVFLSGLLGNVQLAAQSIIGALLVFLYIFPFGIGAAAGVNVGKYLGAGEPDKAVNEVKSSLFLTWGIGLLFGIILLAAKDYIGFAFTSSIVVVEMIAKVAPLIAGLHLLDCTQTACSGILRSAGLHKQGAAANFIGLDLIGLPLGAVFALVLKWDLLGYWAGFTIGMAVQMIMLLMILGCRNWEKLSVKARRRALAYNAEQVNDDEEPTENTWLKETERNLKETEKRKNSAAIQVHGISKNAEHADAGKHTIGTLSEVDDTSGQANDVKDNDAIDGIEENIELKKINALGSDTNSLAHDVVEGKTSILNRVLHVLLIISFPTTILTTSILIHLFV